MRRTSALSVFVPLVYVVATANDAEVARQIALLRIDGGQRNAIFARHDPVPLENIGLTAVEQTVDGNGRYGIVLGVVSQHHARQVFCRLAADHLATFFG